jgi:hypothetical protein
MCLFILGWIPGGQATASATAPTWYLARLAHVPGWGRLHHHLVWAAGPAVGRRSTCHIVRYIRSGGRLCRQLALVVAVVTHTLHTTGMPLLRLGSCQCTGAATFASSGTEIGGPSCSLRLRPNSATPGILAWWWGATRGRCVRPDGDALACRWWTLFAVATEWWLRSSSPTD